MRNLAVSAYRLLQVVRETTEADISGNAARDNTARRQLQFTGREPAPPTMMKRARITAYGVPSGLRPPSEPVDRENYAHFTDVSTLTVNGHAVSLVATP